MRSPIIGIAYGHDPEKLKQFVKASTEITHSDPKAYYAALAVALAAYQSASEEPPSSGEFRATLRDLLLEEDAQELHELLQRPANTAKGISGYSYHTVQCVLQVWFGNTEDFARGTQDIIKAGGDTDTAGAIYGGVVGARVGKHGIPTSWLDNIIEWPRSIDWIERLGEAVASSKQSPAIQCPRYFVPGVLLRNLFFLLVVLAHGFRRLAPRW
jgi:ADP-ribosylglycohydrolase